MGKLQVQVLPTIIYFEDGVAKARLQGFQGLTEGMPKGKEDEFPTPKLGVALAGMGAIDYTAPPTLDELRKVRKCLGVCGFVYVCAQLPLLP